MSSIKLFITGTGTNVGKTFVAGTIIQGARATGRSVHYFKPVQTGFPDSDTDLLKGRHAGATFTDPLYLYDLPASPDQAAEAAAAAYPDPEMIRRSLATMNADVSIIEGAGGLIVPLNDKGDTWLSLLQGVKLPTLVVAQSGLGTINHTCLSLDALKQRGVPVIGVVLSGTRHPANKASIARLHPDIEIFELDTYPNGVPSPIAESLMTFVSTRCGAMAQAEASNAETLQAAVRANVWFPYTQHQTGTVPDATQQVTLAKGVWLETADGSRMIDGISSWWVNNIGHGRPEIAEAIARQQRTVDHTIFAGLWHEPATRLAHTLTELSGPHLSRVFFSDNGSTALEVALKIAVQSFANRGEARRHTFISLSGSYHGDTFGAMSVGDSGGFHGPFRPLLFRTLTTAPATKHKSSWCPGGHGDLAARLREFDELFEANLAQLAGVVIEPLIMGAGGMLVHPRRFLKHIASRCKDRGIPLIADEVFTGFCRTGAWFAYQRADILPDIIACAKGITGGTMPLAVTMATEQLFADFLSNEKSAALMHGHSYTANPIGCAAANAAIAIQRAERLHERALWLEETYNAWITREADALRIENPRALGGVLAFELPGSGSADYFHTDSSRFTRIARNKGLFLRPLGNTAYFMPPLVISAQELSTALTALTAAVEEWMNP